MAAIVVTMTPDEARLYRAQQKLIDQAKQLDAGYGKVGKSAKKAGGDSEKAAKQQKGFAGPEAISALTGVASGYAAVSKAIGFVNQVLVESIRLKKEDAQLGRNNQRGLSSLAQLANTPQQFKRLTDAARQTFREGAGADLNEAAALVFQLESAGALGSRKLFSQLGARGIVEDPAKLAKASATLRAALGEKETGGLRAIVSKGFAASGFTPATVEQLLESAGRGGGSALALGISDEEVLAATAALAPKTGSAEQAGTQLAALLRSLDKAGGFQGKTLQQSLAKVKSLGLEGEDLFKFFGRAEAVEAYRTLTGEQQGAVYRQALGGIRKAQAEDLVRAKLRLPGTDTAIAAAQVAQQQKAGLLLRGEGRGATENLVEAVHERMIRHAPTSAQAAFNYLGPFNRKVADVASLFGAAPYEQRLFQGYAEQELRRGPKTEEDKRLLLEVLSELKEMGVTLNDAAKEFQQSARQQNDYTHQARLQAAAARND